mmetsp:Transcript_8690/g.26130  ORF Transcript_8690/g.26130 Transcript_8690/m.26130 type:complete len:368 (-) Transcript_8690:3068-4171(-)
MLRRGLLRSLCHRPRQEVGGFRSAIRALSAGSEAVASNAPSEVEETNPGDDGQEGAKMSLPTNRLELETHLRSRHPKLKEDPRRLWKERLPAKQLRTQEQDREYQRRRNDLKQWRRNFNKALDKELPFDRYAEHDVRDALQHLLGSKRSPGNQTFKAYFFLNIDVKKSNQLIRQSGVLPHGPIRSASVCVFAMSPQLEEARAAGAKYAGGEDLINLYASGREINFTRAIATPQMMSKMAKLARILGPKGLMPNPKHGTLTTNVAEAVALWNTRKFLMKNDRDGVVEAQFGRRELGFEKLLENFAALCLAIYESKPDVIKSNYVRNVKISVEHDKAISVTKDSLNALLSHYESLKAPFMLNGVLTSVS